MGANSGLASNAGRQSFRGRGRRRSDDDDGVEAGGRELRLERAVLAQAMFHEAGIRPLDLNVLSDQQSIIGARRDHQ